MKKCTEYFASASLHYIKHKIPIKTGIKITALFIMPNKMCKTPL